MKIRLTLLLLVFTLLSNIAAAKYVQTCSVKYRAGYGWSKYYQVDVTFLSGAELNTATNTYNYAAYSTYAVVFWGEGQATIIQLSSYTGCGTEVTKSCIANSYTNMKGEDQQGKNWEVCVTAYCY